MASLLNRRDLLTAATGTFVAASLPRLTGAATEGLAGADLGNGLVHIDVAGSNVVALGAADRVLLVDGGLRQHSASLLAFLGERWPGQKVDILFNTNWRDEHSGANQALRAAGATIMAHENTKLWLGGDFFVTWEDRQYRPQPADALPNRTFYTSGSVDFGGRSVEYHYLPRAHTDGDVCVFFPEANVLAASDLLSIGRYPILDYVTGGWIGGMVAATRALLDLTDARTQIVPAVGPVGSRSDLEAQLTMCTAVRAKLAEAFRVGMSFNDFVAAKPTSQFDAQWGDPAQFLALAYKGALGHLRELGGVI
jgi:glyoxylase-like metal-dependent hydrolase (beta-lactamase superfamily II)